MWEILQIHSTSAGNFFYQAKKLLSAEIWKNTECHFWANVMLRQPRIQASRASSAQKSRGLRVVLFQKLFKGYIFCFLRVSVGRCIFEQFARETNLKKKRSVCVLHNNLIQLDINILRITFLTTIEVQTCKYVRVQTKIFGKKLYYLYC